MANKNYQSNIPRVKYVLTELERAALKEIGRFITKEARGILASVVKMRPKKILWKSIGINIRRKEKSVRIGVRKKGFYGLFIEKGHKIVPKGHYAKKGSNTTIIKVRWKPLKSIALEFGGRYVRARPFLTPAAERNIEKIKTIAAKYIKTIENEDAAKRLIDEKEVNE